MQNGGGGGVKVKKKSAENMCVSVEETVVKNNETLMEKMVTNNGK